MNKEEFAIDEKTYENQDGLKIKIIFSNLGRRYKKIGDQLYLMIEKETARLEDSLTAMTRISKENEEIDKKKEIEIIKNQANREIQQLEETKNTKIIALEKELNMLKALYENKQREKNKEIELTDEINKFKQILQPEEIPRIEEIDNNIDDQKSESSEISETYTELLENIEKIKNVEINTGDVNM